MRRINSLIAAGALAWLQALAAALPATASLPAFPGAEGFGTGTDGGRGGRVIHVTSLSDSGPGSLRSAIEAFGPRMIVFDVGGTIRLKRHLTITNPYVTIAGQSAPGGGILIRDAGLVIQTHDVVVRHLRIRVGDSRAEAPDSQDALHIGAGRDGPAVRNVVIDHCSLSWAIDENADVYGNASDCTFQWCIFSEGLKNSLHPKGAHSMGLLMGPPSTRVTVHHCLFAHNNTRNPRSRGGQRRFYNNVVYNWGEAAAALTEGADVRFEGNSYLTGPSTEHARPVLSADHSTVYLSGNELNGQAWDWEAVNGEGRKLADKPFPVPGASVQSAANACKDVVRSAGCSFPRRDGVDERIARDVKARKGQIIDSPAQVGGFPEILDGRALPDSDKDGMPDSWEKARGLNPEDAGDAAEKASGSGYTNLEVYLNSLALPGAQRQQPLKLTGRAGAG